MRYRILAMAASLMAAITLGASSAHGATMAPPPPSASAWHYNTYIHSESNGGCMGYNAIQHLEPIIYVSTCSSASPFAVRDLSGTEWSGTDEYEIADNALDYAVGDSGGLIKLETPSLPLDTTYSEYIVSDTYWEIDIAPGTNGNWPEPSSNGNDLTVVVEGYPGSTAYTDEWAFCPSTDKTCTETPNYG